MNLSETNMSLIPYAPFRNLDWFDEDWEMPRFPVIEEPRMDIYEEDNNVVAEIEVPKIDPKKIEVSIKDNILRIEGGEEKKEEERKKGYYRKEISRGHFRRIVSLPVEVKEDKVDAVYQDGILKIVMPKITPSKKKEEKKIKVQIKR